MDNNSDGTEVAERSAEDAVPPTKRRFGAWSGRRPAVESLAPNHLLNVVGTLAPEPPQDTAPTEPALPGSSAGEETSSLAERAFEVGQAAHNRGDVALAERNYRRALIQDPGHYRAARYYAKILLSSNRFEGTRRILLAPFASRPPGDKVVWDAMLKACTALGRPLPRSASPVTLPNGRVLRSEHFVGVDDHGRARALFRQSVTNIDLELFSYCNRRCLYCPNAFIDRISANHYLSGDSYRMLVRDLAAIDYSGKVTLNFYNEPLADPVTVEACREIRRLVPRAFLRLNTNGDYLREDSLDELRAAGLNHLIISLHVSKTLAWDDEKVRFRAEQIFERTKLRPESVKFIPGRHYRAFLPFKGMKVEIMQGNYNEFGYNIGGLMKHIPSPTERRSPCLEPFGSMTVTYNGELTACCRIRGDAEEHRPYRCGNLADFPSIYQAWASAKLAAWRRHLIGFNPKASPCDSCIAVSVARTPDSEALHRSAACLIDQADRPDW